MIVDIDKLECRSAFEIAAKPTATVAFSGSIGGAGSDVHVVEFDDVLYLPHILDPGQSVCLVGGTVVPEESVLDPFAVDFLKSSRAHPELQRRYGGDFAVYRFAEPVCILGNLFSRNFGHWTEELLKVLVLEQAGIRCCYAMPTLPPFARAFLQFLGIDDDRLVTIDLPTMFSRVFFSTTINHQNIAAFPQVLARLRALVQERLGTGTTHPGRRVWLEREASVTNTGVTRNREEVYGCIARYGFEVIDMATLPLPEQLRVAQDAAVLAGPHGAQFVHAQFMPRGSTVIECFSPIHVNPSILQICRALGHSYHQIVSRSHLIAPYEHGRDCQVDCEHLELVLDSL